MIEETAEVDLNSPDLFEDENFERVIREEADFGMEEVSPELSGANLRKGAKILEVGCGTGMLLAQIAKKFPDYEFYGLEPIGPGFDAFSELLHKIRQSSEIVDLLQSGAEDFESDEKFDFVYSVNVFEHLEDWRQAIENCLKHLADDGQMVFLCPNYDFPYEPHFSIPVFFDKKTTEKIFRKKIQKYHEKVGNDGPWESLNFIKASEVKKHASRNGYQIQFDRSVFARMLERLTRQEGFSDRHGVLAVFGKLFVRLGFSRIVSALPLFLQPYMKVTVRKSNPS